MSNDERNIPGIKVPPPLIYLLPLVSDRPVSRLTTEGPFRYTRNPACLGLAIIYAGIAVLRNALWTILPLPPVRIVIQREVIGHEERYLERSLGEDTWPTRGRGAAGCNGPTLRTLPRIHVLSKARQIGETTPP